MPERTPESPCEEDETLGQVMGTLPSNGSKINLLLDAVNFSSQKQRLSKDWADNGEIFHISSDHF